MGVKTMFPHGAQVEHGKFGFGTVLSCDDERIVIRFDEHGEKKFVTPMVLPAPPYPGPLVPAITLPAA